MFKLSYQWDRHYDTFQRRSLEYQRKIYQDIKIILMIYQRPNILCKDIKNLIIRDLIISYHGIERGFIFSIHSDVTWAKLLMDMGTHHKYIADAFCNDSYPGRMNIIECLKYKGDHKLVCTYDTLKSSIGNRYHEMVSYLLEYGNYSKENIDEALKYALSIWGNVRIVEIILDHGGDVETALVNYVDKRDIRMVKKIIEKRKCSISIRHNYVIKKFTKYGDLDMVEYLKDKGADLNIEQGKLLLIAVCNSNIVMAKYLLENGLDIHSRDDMAIIYGVKKDDISMIMYLVSQGIDINAQNGKALLMALKLAIVSGKFEITHYLLDNGAHINFNKNLIMRYAIRTGNLEVIKKIIQLGMDPRTDKFFISHSIKNGHLEVVKFLLENYPDMELDDKYISRCISKCQHPLLRDLLIKYQKSLKPPVPLVSKIISEGLIFIPLIIGAVIIYLKRKTIL